MLSLYQTKYMSTDKLWSDWTRIWDDISSVEYFLNHYDFLSLPTSVLGLMNRIPVGGFYPEEEIWFYSLHVEWLAKRPKFLSLALYERGEDVNVFTEDLRGKFSPDFLLYARETPITFKQQCQSWLIDRGTTCNIQSQPHLKAIFLEMKRSVS